MACSAIRARRRSASTTERRMDASGVRIKRRSRRAAGFCRERGAVVAVRNRPARGLRGARRRSPCRNACRTSSILTFLWAGLALAWNIAGGFAGLISFGHAAFFGVGAYTSTHPVRANYGMTPWIGLWLGGLLAAAFGAVLALICARLRGPFFILSTLAAAEVVRIGALNWASFTGGPEGLSILPIARICQHGVRLEDHLRRADAGLFRRWSTPSPRSLEGSRFGYYLFAVRDDEEAASAAGVNPLLARDRRHGAERRADRHRRLAVCAIFSLSRSRPT